MKMKEYAKEPYLFMTGGRFFLRYAYVDLMENGKYVADSLICRHRVPVRYKGEYAKDGEKYLIVICKVRKKYRAEFEKALSEIENKMSLLGHNDYAAFFADMKQYLVEGLARKTEPEALSEPA